MYFIDFDRTAFDTDSFIQYLKTHPVAGAYTELPEAELAKALNSAVLRKELIFAPGELSPFLYEDAGRFLRDKENGVMLITYGNEALQRAKVESAIYGIPRISTIYTGEVRKGNYLAPHMGMYGQAPVFVDDSIEELEIFSAQCPGASVYEIRRNNAPADGRWTCIENFSGIV